jgi:hypothetical protein
MAILESLPGIRVQIAIDRVPQREYEEPDPDELYQMRPARRKYPAAKSVTRYIEAINDANFAIQITVRRPYVLDSPSLSFLVLVDGEKVGYPLLPMSDFKENNFHWVRVMKGFETGGSNNKVMPFVFSEIKTSKCMK